MKREFLENLGLEKDTIDKIMAENGKGINEKKAEITAMTAERDKFKADLDEANSTIKGYKDMKIDDIKKSASEWEEKAKQANADLEAMRKDSAMDKVLSATKTIDADLLKKALDHEAISYKDGKFIGLDEQIKSLQESKPYLFQTKEPHGDDGDKGGQGSNGLEAFVPPAGDDGAGGKSAMAQEVSAILGL